MGSLLNWLLHLLDRYPQLLGQDKGEGHVQLLVVVLDLVLGHLFISSMFNTNIISICITILNTILSMP